MNFWQKLYQQGRPVVGLSPMDGVTDAAMRYMTARYGRSYSSIPVNPYSQNQVKRENGFTDSQIDGGVDVLFTEFVSVDALHYATGDRRERLLRTFMRARDVRAHMERGSDTQDQRSWPYEIAQVFGTKPELFVEAAKLVESLGFDGIDINMGCPAHKVEENGSGAGLIRTPELAQEIVRAVQGATKLPVSVKTRIGVDKVEVEEWMEALCEVMPENISLHGRTLRQLYQGSADWEAIGRAAEVVHKHGGHILGNGDIQSMQDLRFKIKEYGVDGGLIGRAAEGNPGVFLQGSVLCKECGLQRTDPCIHQRLVWMMEHAKVFEEIFLLCHSDTVSQSKAFMPMRKHLAWYCKGFPGAVELRSKLMMTNSSTEVEEIVATVLTH